MSQPESDPWLRRVQALLAKAESTEFPDEAEALVAKAQTLMTRHSIDQAMLAAAGRPSSDTIASEAVVVPVPYASAKASLLANIALANGCRCVCTGSSRGPVRCVVVGFRSDLTKVTTLFAALSMHATRAMLGATVPLGDAARRFRHAFLLGFATRIGARLQVAAGAVRKSAEANRSADGDGVALVLADRDAQVLTAFEDEFPTVRRVRRTASSGAGVRHGEAAADRAPLGQDPLAATRGLPR